MWRVLFLIRVAFDFSLCILKPVRVRQLHGVIAVRAYQLYRGMAHQLHWGTALVFF